MPTIQNKTKGFHVFGVEGKNVALKPGDNPIDDELWNQAKERHEGIRELIRDRKFLEVKTSPVIPSKAPATEKIEKAAKK